MKNVSNPAVITVEFSAPEAANIRTFIEDYGPEAYETGGVELRNLDDIFKDFGIGPNRG